MGEKDQSTEDKILAAAEEAFVQYGFEGARMQGIADKAGINKALLHYYFRSKEQLFEKIFELKVKFFFPSVQNIMNREDISFTQKMQEFTHQYISFILRYPFIPFFVIRTVHSSGTQGFISKIPFKKSVADAVAAAYFKDHEKGLVAEVDPIQFLLAAIGMCVFPFLARPILKAGFDMQDGQFEQVMKARIPEVQLYIRKILAP